PPTVVARRSATATRRAVYHSSAVERRACSETLRHAPASPCAARCVPLDHPLCHRAVHAASQALLGLIALNPLAGCPEAHAGAQVFAAVLAAPLDRQLALPRYIGHTLPHPS